MSKLPVNQLSKLVKSVGEIASLSWNIFEDGTVDFKDIDEIWKLLRAAQCLASLPLEELKLEWADLDDGEREYLVSEFKNSFDIPDDEIEIAIEKIIGIICETYSIILKVKKIF